MYTWLHGITKSSTEIGLLGRESGEFAVLQVTSMVKA
jgi:hypothetical protein